MHISVKSLCKTVAMILVLLAYVVGAYAFSQNTTYYNLYSLSKGDRISYDKARVISIDTQQIAPDKTYRNMEVGTQTVTIRMLTGEYKGQEMKLKNVLNYDINYRLSQGQNIVVSVNTASNGAAINIFLDSPNREPWLYVLIGLFVLSLCAIGGRKGFKSVIGIVFTLSSVLFVFIPLLYRGASPALAALVMAGITACVTLLLTGGWEIKTLSAIIGTFISVAFSAGILRLSEFLISLSGYNMPEYDTLLAISGHSGLRVDELLFASIIIASLGAVMDIAISIASSVNEVFISNPQANAKTLFRSGMNVGRDMMGTMANTLILAFTGSSLNMLILIYTYKMQYYQIMNSSTIAIEIVTALSGSLAVVFTVPLVSLISAKFLSIYFNARHKSSVSLELPAQERPTEVHVE